MTRATPADAPLRALVAAIVVSVGGFAAMQLFMLPAVLLDPAVADPGVDASWFVVGLSMALGFVGLAAVGAAFLWVTNRGWSYIDLRWPSLRELAYAVVGVFAAFGLVMLVNVLAVVFEVEAADATTVEMIGDDTTLLLVMVVVVFLFNAPAEEFVFRNVVQKRLYDAFSRMQAVVIASVIFAVVHLPTYGLTVEGELAPPGGIAIATAAIFGGSLVFGYLYAKTDNLVVPTVAHALYNAIQLGLLYLVIEFGDPEDLEAGGAILGAFVGA